MSGTVRVTAARQDPSPARIKAALPDGLPWEPGAGGRRPGGSDPPEGSGVVCIPGTPSACQDVSDSKQDIEAHPIAWGSVRMKAVDCNPAQAGKVDAT